VDDFRRAAELKYASCPTSTLRRPTARNALPDGPSALFEYPGDPTSWLMEDEYLFGHDLLVAPLMEETTRRAVYLPPGAWIDYQTHKVFAGGRWHTIEAGEIPAVILVRDGAVPAAHFRPRKRRIKWIGARSIAGLPSRGGHGEASCASPPTASAHTATGADGDGLVLRKIQWREGPLAGAHGA